MSFQNNPVFINNVQYPWTPPSQNIYNFNNSFQSFASTRKEDDQFVNKWLSVLPSKSSTTSSKTVHIPEIRKSFIMVFNNCENIRKLESELRKNVDSLSETEWNENMKKIANWKREISELSVLENQDVYDRVKKKIQKRAKKRARLKRKRDRLKLKKKEELKLSEIKRKQIDVEIEKMKEELEKNKKEEEFKATVDNVVRDVNKRKATARRYMSLLDALIKLRNAREKSASGRGEKVNTQASQEFAYNIGKLKELWEFALSEYSKEENELRDKLSEGKDVASSSSSNVVSKVDEEIDVRQWRSALFGGEDVMPQRTFQHIYQFLTVREQWDQYVTTNSNDGSTIPIGWVTPPSQATEEWIVYNQIKSD